MRRTNYGSLGVSDPERMIVPVAIREDLVARLQIPVDLTLAEAEKIARVVLAYASSAPHPTALKASAIEARRAAATKIDAVHESAVAKPDAPPSGPSLQTPQGGDS